MPEFTGRLRTPRLPSAPASPVVGEMYYDTTLNQLLYWNGTAWTASAGGGGADLVYNGQFPTGGPNYTDGDIVIGSDGIAYICVQPTSAAPVPWTGVAGPVGPAGPQGPQGPAGVAGPQGAGIPTPVVNGQWVKGTGGAAIWAAITQADLPLMPYGTTLPASPFHGQEAILVDSITNPSYQWMFRYNANSTSAYKWEFIGGAPATSYVDTNEPIIAAAGGYGDLATLGPSFTLPRSGEYDLSLQVWANIGNASNWVGVSAIIYINTVGTWTNPIIQTFSALQPTAGIQYTTAFVNGRPVGIAVGSVLRIAYGIWSQSGTGAPYFGRRRFYVTPVRVS
jgi:hypothetical protein